MGCSVIGYNLAVGNMFAKKQQLLFNLCFQKEPSDVQVLCFQPIMTCVLQVVFPIERIAKSAMHSIRYT